MSSTTIKSTYVKVAKLPGKLVRIEYDEASNLTVEQALEQADMEVSENQKVQLNGEDVPMNAPVNAGDSVTVAAGAKGA